MSSAAVVLAHENTTSGKSHTVIYILYTVNCVRMSHVRYKTCIIVVKPIKFIFEDSVVPIVRDMFSLVCVCLVIALR
jgi:hypothetical protein